MMTKNIDLLTLRDLTLTRPTAKERGYAWVLDILTELPDDLLEEFFSLVKEKGYLFGKGADDASDAIGLYRPLSKKTSKQNSDSSLMEDDDHRKRTS